MARIQIICGAQLVAQRHSLIPLHSLATRSKRVHKGQCTLRLRPVIQRKGRPAPSSSVLSTKYIQTLSSPSPFLPIDILSIPKTCNVSQAALHNTASSPPLLLRRNQGANTPHNSKYGGSSCGVITIYPPRDPHSWRSRRRWQLPLSRTLSSTNPSILSGVVIRSQLLHLLKKFLQIVKFGHVRHWSRWGW
jgi:hypothetical protein